MDVGDGDVRFYDLARGKELRQVEVKGIRGEVAVLSADGSVLAAVTDPNNDSKITVAVCEVRSGKRLADLEPLHNGHVYLALSPDGKTLVSYGSLVTRRQEVSAEESRKGGRTVQLWDVAGAKEKKRLEFATFVRAAAYSPDGKTLAVCTRDELQLYDAAAAKRLDVWRAPSRVRFGCQLLFSPDGKRLVLTSRHEGLQAVWDLATGKRVPLGRAPTCVPEGIGFRGGRIVAVGHWDQQLVVWDVTSGERFDRDVGHAVALDAVAFRDGRILTASVRQVIEWDLSGRPRRELPQAPGGWVAAFSADGGLAVSGSGSVALSVSRVASGEEIFTVPAGEERAVAFSPDGGLVAVPMSEFDGKKRSVRVVRTDSGKEILDFDPGAGLLLGLAFHPSGKRLAVATVEDRNGPTVSVVLWRIDANRQDGSFRRYQSPLKFATCAPAFSPDGSLLAVGGLGDGDEVRLLDAGSGKERATMKVGARLAVLPVFSPDGRSLAVVVSDDERSSVALWELRSGKRRWSAVLPAEPTALAFDPSGHLLVTAHADTTALVWDVTGRYQTDKVRDESGWDALVKDLSSSDSQKAFAAQRALAAGADLGVEQMAKRVKRAAGKSVSAKELAALVKGLDDDDQAVRSAAFAALEAQGKAAEPALLEALKGKPSAEVRRSANALLEKIRQGETSPETLRAARVAEVLEWIGTPQARRLLADLAGGRTSAPLTHEAKAALARLSVR
jgi:WD40 repeat protein